MKIELTFATAEEKTAVLESMKIVIESQGATGDPEAILQSHLETSVKQLYVKGKILKMEQLASKPLSAEADALFVKVQGPAELPAAEKLDGDITKAV